MQNLILRKTSQMSYVKIWVHVVFSTKYRKPFLNDSIRGKVFSHIIDNCREKEIYLRNVNGYFDHAHCLLSLGSEQSISKVVNLIKGESSFWINKNKLVADQFKWQNDFWAVSVSESQVERVANYINNQEAHHSKKTFNDELDELVRLYGFKKG